MRYFFSGAKADHKRIGTIFLRDILAAAPDLDVQGRVVPVFMLGAICAKTAFAWRAVLLRYPYGVACDSLKQPAILEKLETLVSTMDDPALHQVRATAMDHELSDSAMMRGFRALVGSTPPPSEDLA